MHRLCLVVAASLLVVPEASAWGTHHLITRAAVERTGWTALDEPLPVESIEAFLAADGAGLSAVFEDFARWQAARGSGRFVASPFDAASGSVDAFWRAARLQPRAKLAYIRRISPSSDAVAPDVPVPLAAISDFAKPAPAFTWWFVAEGQTSTARDVLATYSDEPDWGFDHELWGIEAYGYGTQNFGNPTGESSKAPIHMWFAHENGLVRTFAGSITESVVLDRVELFTRLAHRAFESGHPYWGWRFAAWACHYTEDLAQPYHSRALPGKKLGYYLRYVVSPAKQRMKTKATASAGNRHFLYEDYVSWSLEREVRSEAGARPLMAALSAENEVYAVADAADLIEQIGVEAAAHGPAIDKALGRAFGDRWTRWTVDLERDPGYDIGVIAPDIDPAEGVKLLEETRADFGRAGRAVRSTIRLSGAPVPR